MEYHEHYGNMEERKAICKNYEIRGLRMLHDDFDLDWKRGEEPHGTLVFTDETEITTPSPDWQSEWDKATTAQEKLDVVAKMMGLTVQTTPKGWQKLEFHE